MRLVALDSLRGLAAFAVVIYHAMLVFPGLHAFLDGRGVPFADSQDLWTLLMTVTPPSLLWAGREAVLLFFVLSGFVLALGFDPALPRQPGWAAFAVKRVLRLLLPCIAISLLLGLLVPLLDPEPRPELSTWFNASWAEPPSAALVLGHALLLLPSYPLNSPMWSLHYEVLVSLFFPVIVLLAARGAAVLAAATTFGVLLCLAEMKFLGSGLLTALLFTPHFALGVLLARHRQALARATSRLTHVSRAGLWLLCYVLLTFRWLFPAGALACDLANGAGGALLIMLVLGSARAGAALQARPLTWLGRVSYSLYLVHVPVLLAMLHLAPAEVPAPAVAVLAPFAALAVAALFHRLVEQPAMRLGRLAAQRIEGPAPPLLAGRQGPATAPQGWKR